MRPIALALILAAPLMLAGCMSTAPESVPLDRDPFALGANETYMGTISFTQDAKHRVDWAVTPTAGSLMVCFVPLAWYADPIDDWDSPFTLEIRGCQRATPEAPLDRRITLETGSGSHGLYAHCEGPEPCAGSASVSYRSVRASTSAGVVILSLLAIGLALRIAADRWDRARIRRFVADRGGRVERIEWRIFGRGWFGERGERVYHVEFVGADGTPREGTFKTSLFSGVWTDALPGGTSA